MHLLMWICMLAALCLHCAKADLSQLVRSGNGFIYDVPSASELELELSNEFPIGEEFPQDAIPVAPSDAELGQADVSVPAASHTSQVIYESARGHGYAYNVPSKRFTS